MSHNNPLAPRRTTTSREQDALLVACRNLLWAYPQELERATEEIKNVLRCIPDSVLMAAAQRTIRRRQNAHQWNLHLSITPEKGTA